MSFPKDQLLTALMVAREASCTTTLLEQLHGSGAVIMRSHSEYGERTLRVRQALHQCKRLVERSAYECKLAAKQYQLACLEECAS